MPQLLQARLKTALSAEIDVHCGQMASSSAIGGNFQHLNELIESGRQSTAMGPVFDVG